MEASNRRRLLAPATRVGLSRALAVMITCAAVAFTSAPAWADSVTATIPVGSAPWGVAITPNGSRAYVANELGSSVSVIDTATNTVIATHEGRQRNRFGSGKGSVPAGSVLHCLDRFPSVILVLVGCPVTDKLVLCVRMLALAQLCEVLCADRSG